MFIRRFMKFVKNCRNNNNKQLEDGSCSAGDNGKGKEGEDNDEGFLFV